MSLLQFSDVSKNYGEHSPALERLNFSVESGEFTALAGPSGSGKSTILNLAAGLDRPSGGEIMLLGREIGQLSNSGLARMRRDSVGFIFQSYNLFPVLTAIENVEYPLALKGISARERHRRSKKALEAVAMGEFLNRMPSCMSGGQQQRVAVARAIVSEPQLVFADEPTANLDSVTTGLLLELFQDLNKRLGITFLFSSHDPLVQKAAKRILHVLDGSIQGETSP